MQYSSNAKLSKLYFKTFHSNYCFIIKLRMLKMIENQIPNNISSIKDEVYLPD